MVKLMIFALVLLISMAYVLSAPPSNEEPIESLVGSEVENIPEASKKTKRGIYGYGYGIGHYPYGHYSYYPYGHYGGYGHSYYPYYSLGYHGYGHGYGHHGYGGYGYY